MSSVTRQGQGRTNWVGYASLPKFAVSSFVGGIAKRIAAQTLYELIS